MDAVKIGIIGDYDPAKVSHPETGEAIDHAAAELSLEVSIDWIASAELAVSAAVERLDKYHGLFASPGFYENVEGGLNGIRFAREGGKPFVAT